MSDEGQVVTNAKAQFNKSLHPRKPEGSLGRTAQDVHLDSHTAPELCRDLCYGSYFNLCSFVVCSGCAGACIIVPNLTCVLLWFVLGVQGLVLLFLI